jgi:hypothetical protein
MAAFPSEFEAHLPPALRQTWQALDSPVAIQGYLDGLPYIGQQRNRAPLAVMQDRQCHCLDGGFFAALALWRLGFRPMLIDLVPAPGLDDDHVLALFRVDGCWGAVAKSNYPGLRYREPVYRSLRELAMSYFDDFFNSAGERTLRRYTRPFDLTQIPDTGWAWDEGATQVLYRRFYARESFPLISEQAAARLHHLDERSFKSGTLGTDMAEVFPRPNPLRAPRS